MSINYCYFSERDKKWKTCDDQKEYKARKDSGEKVKTLRDKTCDTLNSESNSDFENWKKDHPESAGWVLYSKKEDCDKYWDTNKYQRDYKYNKDEQKTYCAIKNIGGTSVTPSPGTSGYKECTDFYQLNCKDTGSSVGRPNTNGPIYKVQGCIGVKQDSFFGPRTQSALQAKIGKNYFTEDQVEAICKGEVPGGASPAIQMPLTQEQKEQYWNDLIEKERIYDQGLIHTLKDGNVVYIVKTELNNPDVKLPLNSLKGADLTVNDFIVMYPIKKGEPRGKFGLLTKYKTPSGEEKVKVEQNPRWYWSPEEEVEAIDMFESKITNILKNVLSEQKFSGRMTTSTQPGTTTTTNTGAQQKPETTTTVVNKPDPKVVQNTIDPIKEETISLLTSIQNMNTFKLGASQKDKSDLNDAITQLRNFDSSKACEGENINLIDDNLKLINNIIAQNKDKFGAGDIIKNLQGVKTNLEKVKSECNKLEASVQTTSGSGTKPTGDQTQQGTIPSQQTTQGSGTQPRQTQEEPKELDATQCRDLVIQYLYGAFTASDMEAVGSAMAKGKILDTDAKTIKNRLCGCYKLGDLNDIEISKNDFTSGKYRLNPDFLNFRFLNKKLKWPEIKKLVQTGKNKGFEIGRGYIDSSFGERKMCIGQVNESVKQTIKSHISEAINKKKKLTESIVNKITKKLI
jgi:hypothetical protein